MNVLKLIDAWRNGPKYNNQTVRKEMACLLDAIYAAELKRLQLEAEYLPVVEYKLSGVSVEPAYRWLKENGYELDIVRPGSMWAVVGLNCIEVGLLKEKHIEGLVFDPNEVTAELPVLVEYIDYERIG